MLIYQKNDLTLGLKLEIMDTSFEKSKTGKIEWLTPPDLVRKLGEFDLDPCCPVNPPFLHAKNNFTILDDGLSKEWFGRVFCNPPYDKNLNLWLSKLKSHDNGIAVLFARTETKLFFENVWDSASGILFVKGRIRFYHVNGGIGGTPGAPSVLVAYGKNNSKTLRESGIEGKFLEL